MQVIIVRNTTENGTIVDLVAYEIKFNYTT